MNNIAPKISIVVVTYLKENRHYLEACLKSVANLDYPKDRMEVILVSSNGYKPELSEFEKTIVKKTNFADHRLHFSEAANSGAELRDEDSKYIFLLSDDTIMTRNSLANMARMARDQVILGPISNCDLHIKYSLAFMFKEQGQDVHMNQRFFRLNEPCDKVVDDLMNANSIYPPGLIFQNELFFYAVLIPVKVWKEIGPLDPKFKTGQDDIDYSRRAQQAGVRMAVVLDCLIWHCGGVTADLALTQETRDENIKYYKEKWGVLPRT